MGEEHRITASADTLYAQASRDWITLSVAERHCDFEALPARRRPTELNQTWRCATRRLETLGQRRRSHKPLPSPANDRGHRHSMTPRDTGLLLRLAAAACVALTSMTLLAVMGAAAFSPQTLLALLG